MRPEGLDCETRFFSPEHYNQQAKEIVSYVWKTEISDQCETLTARLSKVEILHMILQF